MVGVPNVTTSALIRNTGGKEREAEKRVRWTVEQRGTDSFQELAKARREFSPEPGEGAEPCRHLTGREVPDFPGNWKLMVCKLLSYCTCGVSKQLPTVPALSHSFGVTSAEQGSRWICEGPALRYGNQEMTQSGLVGS